MTGRKEGRGKEREGRREGRLGDGGRIFISLSIKLFMYAQYAFICLLICSYVYFFVCLSCCLLIHSPINLSSVY